AADDGHEFLARQRGVGGGECDAAEIADADAERGGAGQKIAAAERGVAHRRWNSGIIRRRAKASSRLCGRAMAAALAAERRGPRTCFAMSGGFPSRGNTAANAPAHAMRFITAAAPAQVSASSSHPLGDGGENTSWPSSFSGWPMSGKSDGSL